MKFLGNFKRKFFNPSKGFQVFIFETDEEDNKKELKIIVKSEIKFLYKNKYEINVNKIKNNNGSFSYELIDFSKQEKTKMELINSFFKLRFWKSLNLNTRKKIIINAHDDFFDDLNISKKQFQEKKIFNNVDGVFEKIVSNKEYFDLYVKFEKNDLNFKIIEKISKKISIDEIKNILENKCFEILKILKFTIAFEEVDALAKIFLKNYTIDISNYWYILYFFVYISNDNGSSIWNYKDTYYNFEINKKISEKEYKSIIKELIKNKEIIKINSLNISTAFFYEKEKFISQNLKKLLKIKNSEKDNFKISNYIDKEQREAIKFSLNNSITIISGAPGTGKTTLVKEITENIKNDFMLLAPTGKASYQLSKKTNLKTKTIHSFLEMSKDNGEFFKNEKNPSNKKIIIIDEFSMINIDLFSSLLKALPNLTKLILIGDVNQIPSIGVGNILSDLIESKKINTFFLNKNYRQKEGSTIIQNAKLINQGKMPIFNKKEFFFHELRDSQINNFILDSKEIKNILNTKWYENQILIPSYIGEVGIDSINSLIQKWKQQNEKTDSFILNSKTYYINDKIIQTSNENELKIFNGEIGFIKEVFFDNKKVVKRIKILFEGDKEIEFTPSLFNKSIRLAYAISIHKFQGSECNDVILINSNSHNFLNSRKLFYTAITRAKEKIIILGSKSSIQFAIKNNFDSKRNCNTKNLI